MNIPKDMKAKKTTITRGSMEGAVHMLKGRMGEEANFASQIAKAAKWKRATMRRVYS